MSRFEELLQALLNGESIDIEPESRIEAILKNIIEGKGVEGLPEPQSRTEAYLMALAEKGVGGGDIPAVIQALTVTENGTYEAPEGVDGYGPVVVNVSATGDGYDVLNALLDRSITDISSNITSIGNYAFQECSALTTANFPVATSIGVQAFYNCKALTTADFPAVTSIVYMVFYNCKALTTADFPAVTSIGNSAFAGCSKLTALILRSDVMCSLSNTNVFNSTPIKSGTGYIYVPRALIEDYKVATNWSDYAAQFRALEDYTVDGTTTGALDDSKI